MTKRVAIVQSNYIPWKGYFDLIAHVDEFVLYDDVQYTRRDWRNRNIIKTSQGKTWLTIPVQVSGRFHQRIDETVVSDPGWTERHWKTLVHVYGKAPFFGTYRDALAETYQRCGADTLLSCVNRRLIDAVCEHLRIATPITWSSDYASEGSINERLLGICLKAGAGVYLSGPGAKSYLDEKLFEDAGVSVEWMDYSGYPEYPQLYPPFEHAVTVLDLLFNAGPSAPRYMKAASLVG
jgi:hypothetical protein